MPHLTLLDRASGTSYRVDSADAVVGRDPSVTLVLTGSGASVVSARHARLFQADGGWWVEDLASRNGTYLGTRRLEPSTPHRLSVGEEISLGTTGPRLVVRELVGNSLGATIAEPRPSLPMQTPVEPQQAFGPARATANHVRVVLRGGDGRRMVAQELEVIIGRSRECGICVEGDMSRAVSRRHARIFYSGWKICIEDLGSRNGTWLNRKAVQGPTIIDIGDAIEFGAGGPRLVVENVELIPVETTRRTETELPAQRPSDAHFVSELPTPAVDRPAVRVNDKK